MRRHVNANRFRNCGGGRSYVPLSRDPVSGVKIEQRRDEAEHRHQRRVQHADDKRQIVVVGCAQHAGRFGATRERAVRLRNAESEGRASLERTEFTYEFT